MNINHIDLETKTDRELLMLSVQTLNGLCTKVDKQNSRIKSLELWRAGLTAIIGFLGICIAIMVPVMLKLWEH